MDDIIFPLVQKCISLKEIDIWIESGKEILFGFEETKHFKLSLKKLKKTNINKLILKTENTQTPNTPRKLNKNWRKLNVSVNETDKTVRK